MSGPVLIATPRHVYLDTFAVINMAAIQAGRPFRAQHDPADLVNAAYCKLLVWMKSGFVVPVFSHLEGYEWLRAGNLVRARGYARVFDSAKLVLLSEADTVILVSELLAECSRLGVIRDVAPIKRIIPYSEPRDGLNQLGRWFLDDAGVSSLDELPKSGVKFQSVEHEIVEVFAGTNHSRHLMTNAEDRWKENIRLDREWLRKRGKGQIAKTMSYCLWNQFLRFDELLDILGAKVAAKHIFPKIDIARCPALALWNGCHWQFVRSGLGPDHNDMHDMASIPTVAYCHAALVDKRVVNCIKGCRLESKPFVTHDAGSLVRELERHFGIPDVVGVSNTT